MSAVQQPEVLTFDEDTHTYYIDGARVPSVTQILDPLNELDGIPRHVLAAAAEFGSHVHQACHLYNLRRLDEDALDPALAPYVDKWAEFLQDSGAVVLASEQQVCSRLYGYAGTADAIVRMPTRRGLVLVDIKTGSTVPRTVGPQTAAYARAAQGRGFEIRHRLCVHLQGDKYRSHDLADSADWNVFQSTLNIWNWRNKNAG